jgi:hypothetical protein
MGKELEAINELSAVLKFLKARKFTQNILASRFRIGEGEDKYYLHETYIPTIKKNETHPKYKQLLKSLQEDFHLSVSRNVLPGKTGQVQFLVKIKDHAAFNLFLDKMLRGSRAKQSDARNKFEKRENKLNLFNGVQYALYDRVPDGIDRHVIKFGLNGKVRIMHIDSRRDYDGKYRLDKTGNYLILNLNHRKSKEQEVDMLIPIGRGARPELCLGIYLSTGVTGDGCIGSTLVLYEDPDNRYTPRRFEYEEGIEAHEVPLSIQKYLQDRRKNRIAIPKRGIISLEQLTDWLENKEKPMEPEVVEMTEAYLLDYHMFYDRNGRVEYKLSLGKRGRYLMADLYEVNPKTSDWEKVGEGVVSRYANILYIHLGEKLKRSFIQIGIGGTKIRQFDCFCGTISGLNHAEQFMVSYPAVFVKASILAEKREAVLQRVDDRLERWAGQRLKVSSPEDLLLDNL